MKNKLFYIVIILFIGCAEDDDNNFHNSYKFKGTNHTLDIVSWNIENFPKNDVTINEIIPIIDSLNVDIVALQEIESTQDFNNMVNQLGGNWIGYKAENSSYGVLSYLINTTFITINSAPSTILSQFNYDFTYRPPYVLQFEFNNTAYTLINVHFKCCDGGEERRANASVHLENYIKNNLSNNNVIVVGDFNDELVDENNVFDVFLNKSQDYLFSDIHIAQNNQKSYWSFPSYPSHIDHILITDELFNQEDTTCTLLLDQWFFDNANDYFFYVSDHRPMAISLNINP